MHVLNDCHAPAMKNMDVQIRTSFWVVPVIHRHLSEEAPSAAACRYENLVELNGVCFWLLVIVDDVQISLTVCRSATGENRFWSDL